MAFTLDGIVIDRIQMGIAETTDQQTLLYTLTQLTEPTIEVSAESKDATDANGTLIKRFYTGKTGTFTAQNAFIDFNILGAATGSGKELASASNVLTIPRIIYVDNTEANRTNGVTITDTVVEGSVHVNAIANNGTMGKAYTLGAGGDADTFAFSAGKLVLPVDTTADRFVVKYDRTVDRDAVRVANKANKYPDTIRLTLKALAIDPCDAGTVRACYIVLPSFQVSPETSIDLQTESTLEYTGELQVDYCSKDKTLYEIYMVETDKNEVE